jgi:hypothetical protein
MSPQLKSFEGPDPKVLLDRIRREVGADAKINGAERVRVGGVLGFFAKEQYRVVVEAEASDVLRPMPTGLRQPAHARANRRARRRGPVAVSVAPRPTVSYEPEPTARTRALSQAGALSETGTGGDMFATLADATDDVNDVADAPTLAVAAQPRAPGPRTDSFDTVLCRIAADLDAPEGQTSGGSSPDVATGYAPANTATTYVGDLDAGTLYSRDVAAKTITSTSPTSTSIASEAATFLAGSGGETNPSTLGALRRVGLDEDMAGSVAEGLTRGGDLEALLLEAFTHLPSVPSLPRRPGSLLVVVGDPLRARELAQAIAGEIGADSGDVPFASLDPDAEAQVGERLLVRSVEEAAELAPGWRRSQAVVVVVDAPLAGPQGSWAAHVITALRPTAVWATVDATCKAEDIRAWAAGLGGVDAVALENLDATVSPAAVLGTGIPVVRLDGRPATAARWTATIVDRINR